MEKKNVNFEDVVYFQEGPGVRNWQFRDSGIKLINIRNLVDSELCLENTTNYLEVEEVENKYKHFLLNAGDFVMASSGVTWGKIAEVHEEHLPLCLNTSIIRLVSKDTDVLDKWYLYYYIKSPQFRRQIERLITGSAQPNFGPSHLKKLVISLPEICNQREAIEQFTKVEAVINKRQKEMELLDNLIKARFVELFGDIISNEKGWKTDSWSNVLKIVNGKNQKAVETDAGEYLICGSGGAMGRATDYLTKENSVIVGRKGNINKPILMREKYWNVDTAFGIEPNEEFINVDYCYMFCVFFNFEKLNKAVTIPSLTKADLLNIEMPIPDMSIQKQFADFVQQVDKSKVAVQKSLEETQILFDSLMQKYFG